MIRENNIVKALIKKIFRKCGIEITRYNSNSQNRKVISLRTESKYKGDVLISFNLKPFLLKEGETFPTNHITYFECFHVANIFLDLGYSVDVINYDNTTFFPKKDYSIFFDVMFNMERIAPLLDKECIKILYPYWSHWMFHNAASYQRHLALQQRKGITLKPNLILKPNLGVEYADHIIFRGGEFSTNTYAVGHKPSHHVSPGTITQYPWPEEKNYETSRRSFLWLGGAGFVHKGLDLVLDAFVQMPQYHLYVCGKMHREKDFERAYFKELYETSNIHFEGFLDITSPEFTKLKNRCVGFINASCSEICCGSVLDCLQGGLIPIVSKESDISVRDFGIILKSCSIDEIKNAVKLISDRPAEELKSMSRRAWEFVRENYSKERFIEEYKSSILKIMGKQGI